MDRLSFRVYTLTCFKFISYAQPPDKISNRNLYRKYFISGQKLAVSEDFYFMTHKMWRFLYSIYGGGPIIKK